MGNLIDDYIKRVTSDAIVIGQLREEIDRLRAELAAAQLARYVLREVAPIIYDSNDARAIALCSDIESALRGLDPAAVTRAALAERDEAQTERET